VSSPSGGGATWIRIASVAAGVSTIVTEASAQPVFFAVACRVMVSWRYGGL